MIPVDFLKAHGFIPNSDLNYCTDNGIEYYIGFNSVNGAVIAVMTSEDNYLITKEELREMSLTASYYGIKKITLYTNYGIELRSKYENAKTIGFDKIIKITI